MTHLFVYGTLLKGEANHSVLRDAELLRPARTAPCFRLVDLGPFPALVRGGSTAVAGELYDVDEAMLRALDEFEDHPHLYRRTTIRLDDGTEADAYLLNEGSMEGHREIVSGDFRTRNTATSGDR